MFQGLFLKRVHLYAQSCLCIQRCIWVWLDNVVSKIGTPSMTNHQISISNTGKHRAIRMGKMRSLHSRGEVFRLLPI